jgi:cytidine deaminase
MEPKRLIEKAGKLANKRTLSDECVVGTVGCAIVSGSGAEYVGVCIDAACGIGFCAEHAAIAAMITAGESRIRQIVAVNQYGTVLSPCGRCRELMFQINQANMRTEVILGERTTVLLEELLPRRWQEAWIANRK